MGDGQGGGAMIALLKWLCVALGFAAFVNGWYREHRFIDSWLSEHSDLPLTTRWRLSATALFSRSLSDRCRILRRDVLVAYAFFLLAVVAVAAASQFDTPAH